MPAAVAGRDGPAIGTLAGRSRADADLYSTDRAAVGRRVPRTGRPARTLEVSREDDRQGQEHGRPGRRAAVRRAEDATPGALPRRPDRRDHRALRGASPERRRFADRGRHARHRRPDGPRAGGRRRRGRPRSTTSSTRWSGGGRSPGEAPGPGAGARGEGDPGPDRRRHVRRGARATGGEDEAVRPRADVRGGRHRRDGGAGPRVLHLRQRRERAAEPPLPAPGRRLRAHRADHRRDVHARPGRTRSPPRSADPASVPRPALPDGRPLGAHLPLGAGMVRAVERAHAIGADALQVFIDNPTAWKRRAEPPAELPAFRERLAALGIGPIAVHASYLVNLAGPAEDLFERSVALLAHELAVAPDYGPGSSTSTWGATRAPGWRPGLPAWPTASRASWRSPGRRAGDPGRAAARRRSWCWRTPRGAGTGSGRASRSWRRSSRRWRRAACPRTASGLCLDTAHLWGAGHDVATAGGRRRARRGAGRPDRAGARS